MQTQSRAGEAPDAIIQPLILDFLHWLDAEPRAYAEVMEFWRTSCPKLPIWEDAVDHGLVERRRDGGPVIVVLTEAGQRALKGQA
jgi:hypothetical protein